MPTLKRRIQELEQLQLAHHRDLAAKYPGCLISSRGVIVILPDPEPEPENRTVVEAPADGKSPIRILPEPSQPTTVEPQRVTYGGLDEPEEGNG
jgi:hypothetical protein